MILLNICIIYVVFSVVACILIFLLLLFFLSYCLLRSRSTFDELKFINFLLLLIFSMFFLRSL